MRFLCLFGAFSPPPFKVASSKPMPFCRVALCDGVICGFHLATPPPWASPSVTWPLSAACCSHRSPPAHSPPHFPLPPLSSSLSPGPACLPPVGRNRPWVVPGKFLSCSVIIIWGDPRAGASTSQKVIWSFLGTWSQGQRQGRSQADDWSGGETADTIADQSPLA